MTATPHTPGTLRARWHAWRARPRYVSGGNITIYPLDGRTMQQRREDEIRIMLYLITQQNTYLY